MGKPDATDMGREYEAEWFVVKEETVEAQFCSMFTCVGADRKLTQL